MIEGTMTYFRNYEKVMFQEADKAIINKLKRSHVHTEKYLPVFDNLLKQTAITIVSWLKYEAINTSEYSVSVLQDVL